MFPGQGAQALGMAVDLVDAHAEARRVFDRGREVLRVDVLEICRKGPEEELHSTRTSQPAIFLHSMAALEVYRRQLGSSEPFGLGLEAFGAAGLSLGEYSALVFAGALEFEDALRIVGLRGGFMQEACDAARGTMASVLGLPAERVESVVAEARVESLEVVVANYNSPDQTVVSGTIDAVDTLVPRLEAAGAKRVVKLKVAGAYHSPLMASATRKLAPHLATVPVREPRVPFYSNVRGDRVEDPEEIRRGLMAQVESSVRWGQILAALVARGVESAWEVGPGRVLAGLFRSVNRAVAVASLGTIADFAKLEGVAAGGNDGPLERRVK